jgi:hypothetical protein
MKAGFPMVKSAESFSIPQKVNISLLKGLSLLPQIILDEKSTMGDQYYPRFERKKRKNMVYLRTIILLSADNTRKVKLRARIFSRIREKI